MVEDVEVLWLVVFGDMGVPFQNLAKKHSLDHPSILNLITFNQSQSSCGNCFEFRLNFWHQIGTTEQRSYWL